MKMRTTFTGPYTYSVFVVIFITDGNWDLEIYSELQDKPARLSVKNELENFSFASVLINQSLSFRQGVKKRRKKDNLMSCVCHDVINQSVILYLLTRFIKPGFLV